MNTDTKDTATIQRLSDDLAQMEQENIQLRQEIIKLKKIPDEDMDVDIKSLLVSLGIFAKKHPVQLVSSVYGWMILSSIFAEIFNSLNIATDVPSSLVTTIFLFFLCFLIAKI